MENVRSIKTSGFTLAMQALSGLEILPLGKLSEHSGHSSLDNGNFSPYNKV